MSVVLLSDVVGAVFASAALAVVKIPKLERKETKTSGMLEEFKEGVQIFREDKKLLYLVTAEAFTLR